MATIKANCGHIKRGCAPRFTIRLPRPAEHGGIISRLFFLIFLIAALWLLYLARVPLLRMAGRIWIVDEAPQPSDAIVMLGGDNYEADRAQKAAELYKAGWAQTVVASGKFLRTYASTADFTQRDLTERGVPTDRIVKLTHRAEDTMQELMVIERLAGQKNWKRVLIVTSNYHTRRTHMLSQGVFPPGIQVRVISAPDTEYNPDDWWQHRESVKIFFHEFVGYVVAEWELRRAASRTPSAVLLPEMTCATKGLCA